MLELSAAAASIIRELASTIAPDDALVRISPSQHGGKIDWQVAFVQVAAPDDRVWQTRGMTLCVAPEVSRALASQLLDVTQRPEGRRLILRPG